MDYRRENIVRQLNEQGIVIASLKVSGKECVVCREKSLRVLGEGYENRTKYICTNEFCNCQFSLA